MADSSRRRSAVKDAITDVLARLTALPDSGEVEELRARAEEYQRERDTWTASAPPANEKEELMKRVLELHLAVAKIERNMPKA
jgi:hypothetical protein